jgi:hypothetical protein
VLSGNVAPVSQMGRWAVGLVVAAVVLFAALVTVVPDDSAGAVVGTVALLVLVVAGGVSLVIALSRRGERGLSVYAAAAVLVAGVLFVLLHSLFISD